jgi:hypothetical protein
MAERSKSFPDNDWQDLIDRVAPVQISDVGNRANETVKYYISAIIQSRGI